MLSLLLCRPGVVVGVVKLLALAADIDPEDSHSHKVWCEAVAGRDYWFSAGLQDHSTGVPLETCLLTGASSHML